MAFICESVLSWIRGDTLPTSVLSCDSPGNSTCFGLPGLSTLSPVLRWCIPFCLDSPPTSFPKTLTSSKLGKTWAFPNLFPISQQSFLYYLISGILRSVLFVVVVFHLMLFLFLIYFWGIQNDKSNPVFSILPGTWKAAFINFSWSFPILNHLVQYKIKPLFKTAKALCVFSCSVVSNSLWLHGLTHQAPLSIEFSRQEY